MLGAYISSLIIIVLLSGTGILSVRLWFLAFPLLLVSFVNSKRPASKSILL